MSVNNDRSTESSILIEAEDKFSTALQAFFKPITRHPKPENFRASKAFFITYACYLGSSKIDKILKNIGLRFISINDFERMASALCNAPITIPIFIFKTAYSSLFWIFKNAVNQLPFENQNPSLIQQPLQEIITPSAQTMQNISSQVLSCPIEKPLFNETLVQPIVQTLSNTAQILSNVKNVLPVINPHSFSFFSQCAVPSLDQANMCIPYMENPISIIPQGALQTVAKVIQHSKEVMPQVAQCPITFENITNVVPKIELPIEPIAINSGISTYFTLPTLGTIAVVAGVGYGIFKLYQHYKQPNIEPKQNNVELPRTLPQESIQLPPIEIKAEQQINEVKELKNACETLSTDSFFIKRYLLTTAIFGKATFYNAVRTTVYLALAIFSLPGVIFQKGRDFFKKKVFQSIFHFNATLASAAGTIFPYAGRKIFQSQMKLLYPSLHKRIS